MNFKSLQTSLQRGIINEWKDIGGEFKDIQQYAKEDLEDIKRECVRMLLRLKRKKSMINNDSVEPMRQKVRKYENILHNSCAFKLNQIIRNNNLLPSIESIINYYKDRPELTQYTLTKEIHRIKSYTIYTHHDSKNNQKFRKITDPSEILAYHAENLKEVNNINDELLWRCSNQSFLADILTVLTTIEFVRPEMGAGTNIEELSFVLDFRDGSVRGKYFINVLMASIPRPLVGMFLNIYFCPARQIFEAQIERIISYDALTEEEINQATIFLSTSCHAKSGIVTSNDARNESILTRFSLQSLKYPSFKRALPEISRLWRGDDQFVIKLRIIGDSRQLRRVRLSRLKINGRISFPALVKVTIQYAFHNKPLLSGEYCDLLFTHYDVDNDCVTIASSVGLVDAIEQFTGTGGFRIDVKLESNYPGIRKASCRSHEANPPFEEKEGEKKTDKKNGREIAEEEEEIIPDINQSEELDSEDGYIENKTNSLSEAEIREAIIEGDNDDTCEKEAEKNIDTEIWIDIAEEENEDFSDVEDECFEDEDESFSDIETKVIILGEEEDDGSETIVSGIKQLGKVDFEDGCIKDEDNYFSEAGIREIILEVDDNNASLDKGKNIDDASVSNASQDSWEDIVAEEHTIIAHAT